MRHKKNDDFERAFNELPVGVQAHAQKCFARLKADPKHPSLHFKSVGRYWSARVGQNYRALAIERDYGLLWFWIGTHAEYDKLIR